MTGVEMHARRWWIAAIITIGAFAVLAAVTVIWRSSQIYLWFKAFHVLAAISWMVGMLYLPRLFVYHCGAEPGSRQSETFKVMERRLLRGIMTPAMIATWALGLWMVYDGGWISAHWLHVKFALVVAMKLLWPSHFNVWNPLLEMALAGCVGSGLAWDLTLPISSEKQEVSKESRHV